MLERRAATHAALGDTKRLLIVDNLASSDLTVAELARIAGISTNLLAHHLEILEGASLIRRHVSEGDRRRKYVSLNWSALPGPLPNPSHEYASVAFVCTHNSARSQFAAALWEKTTGQKAQSAGSHPADRVHPLAVKAANGMNIDLSETRPKGYETLRGEPDLVVSVCDRAREIGVPTAATTFHWSVPDPVRGGNLQSFHDAFVEISSRIDRLGIGPDSAR
jgi:ArsR family transcriptional regulator, arsenate/arsenite/antimonite-responsive transcriptional repressor / arsenate reductase (thioredoxin)